MRNYKPQHYIFRKSRKKIEIFLLQLFDQFIIQRNYTKSFKGYKTDPIKNNDRYCNSINKIIFGREYQ